jgi:hypothetical protein
MRWQNSAALQGREETRRVSAAAERQTGLVAGAAHKPVQVRISLLVISLSQRFRAVPW